MRGPVVSIRINDLIDFLSSKSDGPLTSKYIELHAAVIMAKFHSKQTGEEHWIALPAKERKRREFDRAEELGSFDDVLSEFVEEDSAQDLFLVPESHAENRSNEIPRGNAFQLKRMFTQGPDDNLEDHIVDYINHVVPKKYGKATHTSLVLLLSSRFSGEGQVNVRNVRDRINPVNFPFDRILIVSADENERIVIGEIWPEFGAAYYTKEQFDSLHG